jgi:hypothetical protein
MSDLSASSAARGAAKIAAASYLCNLAGVASSIIIPRFLDKNAFGRGFDWFRVHQDELWRVTVKEDTF